MLNFLVFFFFLCVLFNAVKTDTKLKLQEVVLEIYNLNPTESGNTILTKKNCFLNVFVSLETKVEDITINDFTFSCQISVKVNRYVLSAKLHLLRFISCITFILGIHTIYFQPPPIFEI